MKLNRIGSNKICYILNQNDLDHYNLTIKDLAYGNEKSKVLINSLIEQLSREINFNPENSNLSVELIPLESGELKIEVSAIDHDDEFNILFSNIIKEYGEVEHGSLDFHMDEDTLALTDDHNADRTPPIQAFEFETLDEIIHISHVIKQIPQLKSSLYKDHSRSGYMLLLESVQKDKDISRICNLILENGGKPNHRYTIKSYCEEHLDRIIKDNAIEQLSLI